MPKTPRQNLLRTLKEDTLNSENDVKLSPFRSNYDPPMIRRQSMPSSITVAALKEVPARLLRTREEIKAEQAMLEEQEKLAKSVVEMRAKREADERRRINETEEAKAIKVAQEATRKMLASVRAQITADKDRMAKKEAEKEEAKKPKTVEVKKPPKTPAITPTRKRSMTAREFFDMTEAENSSKMPSSSTSKEVSDENSNPKEAVGPEEPKRAKEEVKEVKPATEEAKPVRVSSPTSPVNSPTSRPAGERSAKKPMRFAMPNRPKARRFSMLMEATSVQIQTSPVDRRLATSTPRAHHARFSKISQLTISPIVVASPSIERKPLIESPSIRITEDSFDSTISWEDMQPEVALKVTTETTQQ